MMVKYLFIKEKKIWEVLYSSDVNLTIKKKGKKYLIAFVLGKFSKGFETFEGDTLIFKRFDALRKVFERTAIYHFIKQNK